MTLRDYDRPFADQANRMAHMPWTLRGYRPLVERPSLRQWIRDALRRTGEQA